MLTMADSESSEYELCEGMSSSEECSLNLSFESSDYDAEAHERQSGIPNHTNLSPRQRATVTHPPTSSTDSEHNARLGSLEWCNCGNCRLMPSIEGSKCCTEIQSVMNTKDDVPGTHCIAEHPGFGPVCLDIYVLITAYFQYRQLHGEIPECPQRYRYTAYRQFVRWCWGYLQTVGRRIRVPIPACAVMKIRDTFPAPDGNYKGLDFVH